ncbi:MAG: hypothetical protein HGA51_11455, partial [Demequinaceae bacterium]|nr:hypothetical protein [Demequinaceae bacterium]
DGTHRETTIDRLTFDPATGFMQVVTPTLSAVPAQTIVDPDPLEVAIGGTPEVGETLTATVTASWTAVSYQWAKGGVDIVGATNATLLLVESDSEEDITVKVTAEKALWSDAIQTSEPVTVAVYVAPDPASDQLGVSFHTVRAGDTISVWGSGYEPGEAVVLTLYSTPRQVATLTANAAGSIAGTVVIPKDVPAGSHTLEAVGADSAFSLAAGITVYGGDALAFTGSDLDGAAAAALALILAGLGLAVARRRRRA